jgi:8-oxo-dGTP pyrophosphatase MutT (NUDIX family)
MANQELYNKRYQIPPAVINYVRGILTSYPTENGKNRAKNIVKNRFLTYQAMKRLKHDMQRMDKQSAQYKLAGGKDMEAFIDQKLNQERAGAARSKEARRPIKADPNSQLKPYQAQPRLNEVKEKIDKNAVAVIVNSDNKILLLKRTNNPDIWQPNKWSLVGGGIEKGETAKKACLREILEETGLEIEDCVESFKINRHGNSEETLFACRYDGEETDVELDEGENSNYGWYGVGEMKYLDTVPHLIEYITLVFKKYD